MRATLGILVCAAAFATSACSTRGFRPPPSTEEAFTDKHGAGSSEIKTALDSCGYRESMSSNLRNGETLDNARARIMECMFSKGYYYRNGWGGMCSVPEYRVELPACANVPNRPRNNYYGQ